MKAEIWIFYENHHYGNLVSTYALTDKNTAESMKVMQIQEFRGFQLELLLKDVQVILKVQEICTYIMDDTLTSIIIATKWNGYSY